MELNKLNEFKDLIESEGILFCYSGPFSQGVIQEMAETIKHRLEFIEEDKTSIGDKIFAVFIEQVQNIKRYSAELQSKRNSDFETRTGIVVIGQEKDRFYSISGNLVETQKVIDLKQKIDKVLSMNKEELKKYYKEKLKQEPDAESKGAGIGIIDMARKADGPITYHFNKIDDSKTFFSFKVLI